MTAYAMHHLSAVPNSTLLRMHPANDLTSRIDEHGNLAVKCDPTRVALHAMYSPVPPIGWASLAGAETWRLHLPNAQTSNLLAISRGQSYYLKRGDAGAILAPSWSASPRAPLQPPMARRTAHSTY